MALPGGEALLALRGGNARLEEPVAPPACSELVRPRPHARGESGQPGRAERARLEDGRARDRAAEGGRLERGEDVVLRRAPVGAARGGRRATAGGAWRGVHPGGA